jgi:hypothetical protein
MNLQNVSVVLPTLNCKKLLEPVIEPMRETLREAGEVIVVDSFSTDGTLEFLQSELRLPQVRFTSHPPGLYASWNFGIRQAGRELLHIATAGDVIAAEDLLYLASVAGSTGADVVTAPPSFVDESGKELEQPDWPVFSLLASHPGQDEILLSGINLVSFALTCGLPRLHYLSWLGSSASNIYRTKVMQARPFPEHAGHGGDALWGLENARDLKAVFCRRRCGRFVLHDKQSTPPPNQRRKLLPIFEEPWSEAVTWLQDQLTGDPGLSEAESTRLSQILVTGLPRFAAIASQHEHYLWSEIEKKNEHKARSAQLQEELKKLRAKAKKDEQFAELVKRRLPAFLLRILGIR